MRSEASREQNRIYMAARRAASEELRQYGRDNAKRWAAAHPERRRLNQKKFDLRVKYGMTWEQFNELLAKQNGLCAICRVAMTPPSRREGIARKNGSAVTVDHCHITGRVRGLLCYECNLALGVFKDSLENLRRAVLYLESAGRFDGEGSL